ncbi:hypothetical protein [Streptomyces fulvoviolaceus]|uniref:hypothetical protein n=1 Tax=Streptomyces fulvoviolaceus TaxID=285535 RepID=UPI0004C59EAF|nr:hypothetical protein [Streptomyces fulvoviolaceus]MCT9084725.1 hypothetical protein [Streptomyces fulvoviolaceus]
MTRSPHDDHWSQPPSAQRPVHITAAAVLLILSALLACSIALDDPEMTQFLYLLFFVTIGAAVRFCGGGRKARVTATVTAALLLLYLGPFVLWGLLDPGGLYQPEYAVRAILGVIASGTGVTLLYVPPGRAYFRAHQRRTGPT